MRAIDHFYLSAVLTFLLNLLLIIFVTKFAKNKDLKVRFIFYGSAIAWWSLFLLFFSYIDNRRLSYLFCQVLHGSSIFIPSLFLHFLLRYLQKDIGFERIILRVTYVVSAFFWLIDIFIPRLFISSVTPKLGFPYFMNPGPIYTAWMLYFFAVVIYGHVILLRGVIVSTGIMRKQRMLFLIGNSLGYLGGIGTFLPVYNITYFPYPYGVYGVALFSVVTAYTSIRFKFIEIDVIIKKTLVFTGLSSFVIAVFAITAYTISDVLHGTLTGQARWWVFVFAGIIIAAALKPLETFLVNITDRYLFQKKINYRILLKEATEYLAYLDSLKRQARRIVAFLIVKARVASASVYAIDGNDSSVFKLKASRPFIKDRQRKAIHLSQNAAQFVRAYKGPLEINGLDEFRQSHDPAHTRDDLNEVIQLLRDSRSEAAIPCLSGDATLKASHGELYLKGILLLGRQKSDLPYSEEVLDVFFTLGQESSIAFENARLYDEAVNKSRELELKSLELQRTNVELNDAQRDLITALEDAEESRKQALLAKEKTEEMELELIRREKLLFVEKLVKGIAHEIFNPLTPMVQYIDRLERVFTECYTFFDERKYELPDEERGSMMEQFQTFRKAIKVLTEQSDHLFSVVDTLTQMQKADDKTIKSFDFKTYWASVSSLIQAQTHGEILEDVPVEEDIPRNLPPVEGNTVQLTQVFLNLYRNALAAMNGEHEKKITVKAWQDDSRPDYLSVSFHDSGSGIPPDILPRIFDYMFTTKGEKGQGIGLNMCRTILERFGGTITCQSQIGKGTTFLLTIPLSKGKVSHEH